MERHQPQFYPGDSDVARKRKNLMNPEYQLKKLREIPDDDLVTILGFRKPGDGYTSVHLPLSETTEPPCPIRRLVKPTPGAKAGDRIRFVQFTDSIYSPPVSPFFRARMYMSRYRGIDVVAYSGRTLLEMRERDLEKVAKEVMETEVFDPARTAIRGITVHGHSLRLDTDGLMFDALRRYILDKKTEDVVYVKDMMGGTLDKNIRLGKPADENELKNRTIVYDAKGKPFREEEEIIKIASRIAELRLLGGINPDLVRGK